jgi:N-acetylglutamate synthase-like GNAT family acetyltransferase
MTNLKIRKASGADATELSSLAFRSKAHWGYSLEFMAACKDELTYTAAMIDAPQNHFYLCEIDGKSAGFYALEVLGNGTAELDALFVMPLLIGRGLGKALMRHCVTLAMQLGVSTIVIQGDPNAEDFYLSCGAKASGYRESASIPGRQLPVFTIKL